jgi:hypothetical protein
MKTKIFLAVALMLTLSLSAKKIKKEVFNQVQYGIENTGTTILITFEKGKEYNHPLFAIWLADENGKYIQTLYVSQSIGKGVFLRGSRKTGQWMPGEIQRPASLPYWVFQRNVTNEKGGLLPTPTRPVVDAYTGATPKNSFILEVKTEKPLNGKYKVMFELNQSWDWNEFWFNAKYPNDKEYKTSSQPALVYSADIDSKNTNADIVMQAIGHSHYSGADGSLNKNISTISTAKQISKKISIRIK